VLGTSWSQAECEGHAFYASADRFKPESYIAWTTRNKDQNTRDRAANCSHVLAAACKFFNGDVRELVLTEQSAQGALNRQPRGADREPSALRGTFREVLPGLDT